MPTQRQTYTGISDMAQRMLTLRDTASKLRALGARRRMVERYDSRARKLAEAVIGCGVLCIEGRR